MNILRTASLEFNFTGSYKKKEGNEKSFEKQFRKHQ